MGPLHDKLVESESNSRARRRVDRDALRNTRGPRANLGSDSTEAIRRKVENLPRQSRGSGSLCGGTAPAAGRAAASDAADGPAASIRGRMDCGDDGTRGWVVQPAAAH
jgi:hypothetical protein